MAETGNPVSQKEIRLGGLSLICLAAGAVGPFFSTLARGLAKTGPATTLDPVGLVVGLRAVFVILALAFGFLGRRSRSGRIGLIGSGVLIVVVLALTLFLFSRHAVARV